MSTDTRILTAKETADRLRISERTLLRISAANGDIKKIRLSPRRVGFLERDINAFLERQAGRAAA